MMTDEKTALLKQMEQQRSLPITRETSKLYDTYHAIIDVHNPDELSCFLFYKGEYFFRTGNFIEALNYLSRCLQAPKHDAYIRFDVLSYNIIGLIHTYLRQEVIAINNLMRGKALSSKARMAREFSICCGNIGNLYSYLADFDNAIQYYNLAVRHLEENGLGDSSIALICEAFLGILYCKANNEEKALHSYHKICDALKRNSFSVPFVVIINLNVRLFDFLQDEDALHDNLNQLLSYDSSSLDFLEYSDPYFDTFDYLVGKKMETEALALLNYIQAHVKDSPLAFLTQHYLYSKISYALTFSHEKMYLQACHQLMDLLPAMQKEQRTAKLYGLEHIERIHQTKNDSAIYHEKSQIDQMTGLLNKYTIQFFVEEDLSVSDSMRQSAMILIDLDHFKQINDTLGHLAGDSFICQTASVIQKFFKEDAFCGRVGGDEFLVYLPHVADPSFVILQSEILRQEIYRETSERNITVTTQASIGIAFSSEYCYNYESMFNMADQALYRAKLEGRNKVVVADSHILS